MLKNPIYIPDDASGEIVDTASLLSNHNFGFRLVYAVLLALISLCWTPVSIAALFVAIWFAWELIGRPSLLRLIASPLIKTRNVRVVAYYSGIAFAAALYALSQFYALYTKHELAPLVATLSLCVGALTSVGTISRSRAAFLTTIGPIAITVLAAPFIMHFDAVNTMTIIALNFLVMVAGMTAIQSNDFLIADIEQASEARFKAEHSNLAKSQFLATMSHELRTPLNAIIGYSEMMKESAQDEGRALDMEDHGKVIRAAHSLLTLINDVLDISKIEAGKMQLKIDSFDIGALVSEAAATTAPLAQRNGNRLEVHASSNLGSAHSDSFRLNQCLLNLLSNAAKFTKNGVVRLDAYRSQKNGADWIVFEISDTGIGMTDEQMEHLFQPFAQADSNITRAYGGTGLGLAITQRIAHMLGGEVEARSQMGAGSLFVLRVPAEFNEVSEPETAHSEIDTDGRRMALVIDDDVHMQELAQRHLKSVGMSVLCVGRAAEGLQAARAHKPAIIVLDINLPDRSGWDVLEELRADSDFTNTPILVVSIEDDRRRALSLGACDLLTKPASKSVFVQSVLRYAPPVAAKSAPDIAAQNRAAG